MMLFRRHSPLLLVLYLSVSFSLRLRQLRTKTAISPRSHLAPRVGLIPQARFRSCSQDQQQIIGDAIINLDILLRPAIRQSTIRWATLSNTNENELSFGQRRFAHWFKNNGYDQRWFVWNHFFSMAGMTGPRTLDFQCDDVEMRCRRHPRLPGYVRSTNPGIIVIV